MTGASDKMDFQSVMSDVRRLFRPLVSTVVMTTEQHSDEAKTGCANSVRAPTWDIQRRRDRLFTNLYRKRIVGKPSLFCEDLGRQIHDPFLLAISRGQFCEPKFDRIS